MAAQLEEAQQAEKAAVEKEAAEKERRVVEARKAKAVEAVKAGSVRRERSETERPPCQTCVKRGMADRCEWRLRSSKQKSCLPCVASKSKCVHDKDEEPAPKPRKKAAGKSGEASPAESGPSRTEKGKGQAKLVGSPAEKPKVVLSMVEVQMQMLGVLREILGEVRKTRVVVEKASELTANNMTAMDGNLKLYTDNIAKCVRTERRKLARK